ncbi:hypothetical protein [Mycobacterium avium]|uniref:Uncharacterized protein n=1 Tax=Mycobacterium avium subsp. hominissuis TaxID=439334 RepID=A0AAI8X5D6_MYCAV|nr:hypothetical protein [Mycobacterium avium]BBN50822.1 hypothetical protein JPH1_52970 [Mycobacterium avium subsp. hominissuis]
MTKKRERSDIVFPVPDRRLVRTLSSAALAAVALVFAVSQLWSGAEAYTGWATASRFFIGAFWSAGACYFASRGCAAWRDYRGRNDAPRIEQIENP